MPSRLRRLLAVSSLAAVLGLAGCGGGGDGADGAEVGLEDVDPGGRATRDEPNADEPTDDEPTAEPADDAPDAGEGSLLDDLRKASVDTLAVGTARVELEMSVVPAAGSGGEAVFFSVGGVVDFANGRAEFAMDLAQMFGDVPMPPEVARFLGEPIRVVQDGTTTYMCGGLFAGLAGAECIRQESAPAGGGAATGFASGLSFDSLLATLGSLTDLEDLGVERVLGATMRHYRGTFSLADAAGELTPEQQAELEASLGAAGAGALDAPMQIDVWVDGDGLVRQLRQEASIGVPAALTSTVEIRYTELDVPVDIVIPTDAVDASTIPGF